MGARGRDNGNMCDAAVVSTVTVTEVVLVGETEAGETEQVASELAAKPVQLSDTDLLKPPEGVNVSV